MRNNSLAMTRGAVKLVAISDTIEAVVNVEGSANCKVSIFPAMTTTLSRSGWVLKSSANLDSMDEMFSTSNLKDFQVWKLACRRLKALETAPSGNNLFFFGVEIASKCGTYTRCSAENQNSVDIGCHLGSWCDAILRGDEWFPLNELKVIR